MKRIVFLLLLTLCTLFFACNDDISSIGLDLIDSELGNSFTDSISLVSYSVTEDSVRTRNLVNNVVGYVNDPIFGVTQAGIASQFLLSGNSVDFGDNPILDSIVLCLKYTGYYGDTLSPIVIRVHELNEVLTKEKQYCHNSIVDYAAEDLTFAGNFVLMPKPNTSVVLDTAIKESHMRIRLKDEFGYHFLNNKEEMANENGFANFFKGLYIVADPTNGIGNLSYINLSSSLSGIQIYYKREDGVPRLYTLVPSSTAVRFNTFSHDFTQGSSSFIAQVIDGDTILGKEKLYVQAGGGVTTKIVFPNIQEEFAGKNIVVNKAELVISAVDNSGVFAEPTKLTITGITSTGALTYIPDDEVYTSSDYYGGSFDVEKREYRIRITKYIQQLLLGTEGYQNGLYLKVSGAGTRGNRLEFWGTQPTLNPNSRLRLEVSYTKY